MPNIKSSRVASRVGLSGSRAGQVLTDEAAVTLTKAQLETLNQLVEMVILPAQHVPVDLIAFAVDSDEDATPAVVASIGVLNAAGDDLEAGQNFLTGTTIGQAGGMARADVKDGLQLAASNVDRVIAIKLTTASEDGPDAGSTWRVRLLHKPV